MRGGRSTWVLAATVCGVALAPGCSSDGPLGGPIADRAPAKTHVQVIDRGEQKVGSGPKARVTELRLGVRSSPGVTSKRARATKRGGKTLAQMPKSLQRAFFEARQRDAGKRYAIRALGGATHAAKNPRQRMRVRFERDAVTVRPDAASKGSAATRGWKLQLRLSRWGRAENLRRVPAVRARQTKRNRIEYRRGAALTEWYLNGPLGLEQGFDIPAPPAHAVERRTPLVLELTAGGGLTPVLKSKGRHSEVLLRAAKGEIVARYRGLHVKDARGRVVPSRLAISGGAIALRVDDRGARYPLVVDPLLVTEHWLHLSPKGDVFGDAVAVSGDTVVVGARHDDDMGAESGSAYVFVRSGTSWSKQQKLRASDGAPDNWFGNSVAINGDTVVVGAYRNDAKGSYAGAAYVFVRAAGGTSWSQQQKLLAADGGANAYFGWSVGVGGDTVVVGARGADAAYVFARPTGGSSWSQQQKLVGSRGFGFSVGISGDTVIVGVPYAFHQGVASGSAHVFVRAAGGTSWSQQQKLVAADAAADRFGWSVAISGDTVVVGADLDDDKGSDSGSAYVFVRAAGGSSWSQQQKLVASDGSTDDYFGQSVAISGDTVVVGAWNAYAGAAYVFVRAAGGTSWSQQVKLIATDRAANDRFGHSVAISGDTVVAGAPGDDDRGSSSGSAYVYVRASGSWRQQQKLATPVSDNFGSSVATSGDTVVVGAPHDADKGKDAGAAYVFARAAGRTGWIWQAKLVAADGRTGDKLGAAVAIGGDTVIVGAPLGDNKGTRSGSAYVFVRVAGTTSWSQQGKLVATDGAYNERFGSSVSISGDAVIVGAPEDDDKGARSGSAYVFVRSAGGTSWSQQTKLVAADGAAGDQLGTSVAISGDTAVVGTPHHYNNNQRVGAAYVFVRASGGTSWSLQQKLLAADGAADDQFGAAVAISGDTLVVGAPYDDDKGADSGSAYVFVRAAGSTSWTWNHKLVVADGAAGDRLGTAVAISGDTVAVTAPYDDDGGNDSGSAYVFVREANGSWPRRAKLVAASSLANDRIGSAVGASAKTVVVGAPEKDADGLDGSAYIFDLGLVDDGQACGDGDECYSHVCVVGTCCRTVCGDVCETCASGTCQNVARNTPDTEGKFKCLTADQLACDGKGACRRKDGQGCGNAFDCVSGHCVDGVCCNSACAGACKACNVAGSVGSCTTVADGKRDPGTCDGVCGVCKGGSCSAVGKGGQVSGVPSCDGTRACDGFGACKKQDGQQCASGADCVSGHCVDGVCCDGACQGACKACNIAGSLGTCSTVADGKRDPGTCDGVCGVCQGGVCKAVAQGTQVSGLPSCDGDRACDGYGLCKRIAGKSCSSGADCASGSCAVLAGGSGARVCCKSACDGPCQVCSASGTCENAPKDTDPKGACVGKHTACGGSCDGAGQCVFPASGKKCGTCKACDGKGDCNGSPKDDSACGVIDCSKLDNACYTYSDVTANRCASFGECKPANSTATCGTPTPTAAPGCEDGGAPIAPDVGVDSGADAGGKAADAGADGKSPGAEGKGNEDDGGCSCSTGRGQPPRSGRGALLMTLVLGVLLALRRRRQ